MNDIINKFKFKSNGVIRHAPSKIESEFLKLGFNIAFNKNNRSTNTLIFIADSNGLEEFLKDDLKKIEPDSVLWLAYPKGTSKIKTDINRDTIRVTCEKYGITTVTAISIDDTWSALRFRPINSVGKK